MTEPRHGNPEPWGQPPYQSSGGPPPLPPPPGTGQLYPPPYAAVPPPKRPNHVLHLILTLITCGLWACVWITLSARYWNVVDYRNPAEHPGMKRRTTIAVSVLAGLNVLVGIVAAVSPADDNGTSTASTTGTSSTSAAYATSANKNNSQAEPPTEPPAATEEAKPKTTVAQEQAIESAQSYVDSSAFSRVGLIEQLSSSAGEGFKKADAVYAVKHIKVDWDAEAVESAKSYLEMGGFSRAGLIEQLHSKAGEGFTLEQAKYAVNKVGL